MTKMTLDTWKEELHEVIFKTYYQNNYKIGDSFVWCNPSSMDLYEVLEECGMFEEGEETKEEKESDFFITYTARDYFEEIDIRDSWYGDTKEDILEKLESMTGINEAVDTDWKAILKKFEEIVIEDEVEEDEETF